MRRGFRVAVVIEYDGMDLEEPGQWRELADDLVEVLNGESVQTAINDTIQERGPSDGKGGLLRSWRVPAVEFELLGEGESMPAEPGR